MNLEARDLAIGYRGPPGRPRHLNVTLAKGEVLALLGPNGGGKTTLLKTMLGLLPPKSGEIRLGSTSLATPHPRARAALGYVPQAHAATFAFTVYTVVLMGRTPLATCSAPYGAGPRGGLGACWSASVSGQLARAALYA